MRTKSKWVRTDGHFPDIFNFSLFLPLFLEQIVQDPSLVEEGHGSIVFHALWLLVVNVAVMSTVPAKLAASPNTCKSVPRHVFVVGARASIAFFTAGDTKKSSFSIVVDSCPWS